MAEPAQMLNRLLFIGDLDSSMFNAHLNTENIFELMLSLFPSANLEQNL